MVLQDLKVSGYRTQSATLSSLKRTRVLLSWVIVLMTTTSIFPKKFSKGNLRLSGFQSTQAKGASASYWCRASTRGNHWVIDEVVVFDSLFSSVDPATLDLLKQLFGVHIKVKLEKYPGGGNCGVFAIANCTTLACPNNASFIQESMRQHLLKCLESFLPHSLS